MGIGRYNLKKWTFKKIFFIYSLIFLLTVLTICITFYIVFLLGVKNKIYYFADYEEKQIEILQQKIKKEQKFDPAWVPPFITYMVVNKNNEILLSNTKPEDQKLVQSFLQGENIPHSMGYFVKFVNQEETYIFKYHIGVRYYSEWANQHLPKIEIIFIVIFIFSILISTILFARFISKRLLKDITRLKHTINLIGTGNLNYPVPNLSIQEFEEVGILTERMRSDLKSSLQTLWLNENQLKEKTAQILHNYRTPLTLAIAKAEFLKEDLSQLNDIAIKTTLSTHLNSVIFNLERLAEIGEHLQEQMHFSKIKFDTTKIENNTLTFNEFNQSLEKTGNILSEYYGDLWQSKFQDCPKIIPIDKNGLLQTLTNIIVNAFEHGKSPQTVFMQFEVYNKEIRYLISNSGSCFSKQALIYGTQKNFSEKKNNQQIIKGLGLYFAQKFLTEHNADITLFNNAENHACVQISLPISNHRKEQSDVRADKKICFYR